MSEPLCFVLIAPGHASPGAHAIDVERIHAELLAPAVRAAGLHVFRVESRELARRIDEPMFEELVLCEYALVDVTHADANLFYKLGTRDAFRPGSTVLTCAQDLTQLPFYAASFGAISYIPGSDGAPLDAASTTERIAAALLDARHRRAETPLYDLLEDYTGIAHDKTDVFLDRVRIDERHRDEILRRTHLPAETALGELRSYEGRLGPLAAVESSVIVAQLLAYREVEAYEDMIRLVGAMPAPLAATVLVREQYALALNRIGRDDDAEAVLQELVATHGPSSETYALLGRVYKDRYNAALQSGDRQRADLWLARAGDTYLKGFEADPRDTYPGVNALTLLASRDRHDPRIAELTPVVRYAARRRIAEGKAGYWGNATLIELAIIAGDESGARAALAQALEYKPKRWMRQATLKNMRLLRHVGFGADWLESLEAQLER
jgi:hypothetical protein